LSSKQLQREKGEGREEEEEDETRWNEMQLSDKLKESCFGQFSGFSTPALMKWFLPLS
jgi:hypothetical protein